MVILLQYLLVMRFWLRESIRPQWTLEGNKITEYPSSV